MPRLLPLSLLLLATTVFAEPPAEWVAAGEKRRAEIPLGGDFKPAPKVPVIIAVGHGARIVASRDDGKTWKQVFFGYPGADHGGWATNAVAYTNGVFAVPVGWTQPTSYLASDDGVNWRNLTNGKTALGDKTHPDQMPTTLTLAGGKGVFAGSGYMNFTATPDFGKTWVSTSLYKLPVDAARPKLVTHHVRCLYCGDASGRFLALGDNRGEGAKFGHLFASDDLGKTWRWLAPKGLDAVPGRGAMLSNGKLLLMTDPNGENAWRSADNGDTWEGPFPTGAKRGTLSVVKAEFWLAGPPSRASADGKTWRDLPASIPAGQLLATDKGTLLSISPQRFNILRSADDGKTWTEVFTYKPETENAGGGAQGLKAIAIGLVRDK